MLNQSPEFQQQPQQHQNTDIEGLDRFVYFYHLFQKEIKFMLNYEHTGNKYVG